jgi:type IV secretion system protein VirB6
MDFFASLEQGMDAKLAQYLSGTVASLCAILAPVVITGITIYVILIGYAVMRGEASDPLHSSLWKACKMALVCGVALSAGAFNTHIVGSLNGIESALFQATTGAQSGGQLLDGTLTQYMNLFTQLLDNVKDDGMGVFPNVAVCFALLLLGAASCIFFGLAVCVFMLAKVAEVLVLALGPVFVATLIFPPVQRFADAWLSAALNTILIKVLAGIVLAISTLFLTGAVQQVSGHFDTTNVVMDCLKVLLLSVAFGFIFGYLPMLSAQLVGGAPLPNVALPRLPGRQRSSQPQSRSSQGGGQIQSGRNAPSPIGPPMYRRNVIGNLNR